MRKWILAAVVPAVMLIETTAASACACCGTWQVNGVAAGDSLNIRSGPGVHYSRVGKIPAGSACVIRDGECKRQWCRISYAEATGWVNSRYLRFLK